MKYKISFLITFLVFAKVVEAQSPLINPSNQLNQLQLNQSQSIEKATTQIQETQVIKDNQLNKTIPHNIELNRDLFFKQPHLLEYLMTEALKNNNFELLGYFVEDYKFLRLQQQNMVFFNQMKWQYAQYLSQRNHWKQAQYLCDEIDESQIYQPTTTEISSFQPEELADFETHFPNFNKQFQEQKTQFKQQCDMMNQWIDHQKMLVLTAGSNVILDKNINNASASPTIQLGNTTFIKDSNSLPQKARGLAYFGQIHKITPLSDLGLSHIEEQHRMVVTGFLNGRDYRHKNQFNDHQHRLGMGYQFDDGTQQINVYPFYGQRFFANKVFNTEKGIHGDYQMRFNGFLDTEKTQPHYRSITIGGEVAENEYQTRSFLNNRSKFIFTQIQQKVMPQVFAFAGLDIYRENPIAVYDRFYRYGIRMGATIDGQSKVFLGQNIVPTLRLQMNIAKRYNDGIDALFNKKREDNEQFYQLSLWNRNWYVTAPLMGKLTPKININYQKHSSNIDAFAFDKKNLFFSLEQMW